MSVRFDFAIL